MGMKLGFQNYREKQRLRASENSVLRRRVVLERRGSDKGNEIIA
jgi:hypothetical protein